MQRNDRFQTPEGRTDVPEATLMARARRIAELWSALPGFRAAAETEHLPTASRAMCVSPSAISRTVRLLEHRLGVGLFDRVGRGIALTPAGACLLHAVRDAMRLVDEAVSALESETLTGHVAIAAPRELVPALVWPALRTLAARHPQLTPRVGAFEPTRLRESLLRGDLDVALVDRAIAPSSEIAIERLGRLEHGVFARRDHPLVGRTHLSASEVAHQRFAVPRSEDAAPPDPWPTQIARDDVLWVPDRAMAADACAELGALAVLPDLVGHGHAAGLARLDVPLGSGASTELYLATRAPARQGRHPRTDAAIDALRARTDELFSAGDPDA